MNELSKTKDQRRAEILRAQEAILSLPQIENCPKHYFGGGMYARELFMPKGSAVIGKIHNKEHLVIISYGEVIVTTDEGTEHLIGPCTFVGKPGSKRALLMLEDTLWTAIHTTDAKNVEDAESVLVSNDYQEYLEFTGGKSMSFFVGGAIVTSAAVGAYSSNKASKEQSKGINKGLEQSAALAQQARNDVMKLFELSAKNNGLGMKGALDYYKSASIKRTTPFIQGNQQAQQVIGQGAAQANNAILGLPVDMSFTNQPQIIPGTDYMQGAQLPVYEQYVPVEPVGPQPAQSGGGRSGGSGGLLGGLVGGVGGLVKKIF